MARTAETIRAEIQAEMSKPRRNRKLIASLEWDLDHATAGDAVNERRAAMGLEPWPNAVEC